MNNETLMPEIRCADLRCSGYHRRNSDIYPTVLLCR